ncbi:uncharacterized protein K441DRAFT_700111 [Cenococcum geophilum 1.58]|uniref:uncharacterized protein n=1 Tax=Cenococcum geophilum 1.58 TaxID=794803 RepID=UPI00358E117A|nr:hypothetical protein K441DRAFT_700111 [Cenococcum geophilum 1.58]
MLKRWFLLSSLVFNLLILGLLITLLFKPTFRVLNQWGYFFIQIFPAVVGTITASFLRGITLTLSRLTPFILCAREDGATAGETILRDYFPDPSLTDVWDTRNFTLGYAWALFILGNFILGFKASLLNTTDYGEAIVSTWALYPLICIYFFIALFMIVVIIMLERVGSTGLRWDPVSLADHLVLFRHSNFLTAFEGTDLAERRSMFEILGDLRVMLGYWRRGNTIWHGFGLVEGDTRSENVMKQIPSLRAESKPSSRKLCPQKRQEIRYRSTYSNMKHIPMYIWTAAAFTLCGLFIAGLATNMREGYEIPLSANLAAFLFQFVLTFIVGLYTWLWEDLDLFTRSTQPFLNAETAQPATENLLLDYNCALPYIVTWIALTNGHWKVARISALAPLQRMLPILVGGSITVVDNGDSTCTCSASLPLFIIIIVWLFLYILLVPYEILEAGYKRHLPRNYRSIADILSWTYASKQLREGDLLDVDVEDEDKRERWYVKAKLQVECKKYLFGFYKSTTRDGLHCMGIDEEGSGAKTVKMPDIKGLSLIPCVRRRSRKQPEDGENGEKEEDYDVSNDPRFTFLLDAEAESNVVDMNAVPVVQQQDGEGA